MIGNKKFMQVTLDNIESLRLYIEKFFNDNNEKFFQPHEFSFSGLNKELLNHQKDVYIFLIDDKKIYGYGFLRGWEEGYDIPSLGIIVDVHERKRGYSNIIMDVLHKIAANKGAKKVRLRVIKENKIAISIYNKLGYTLSNYDDMHLIGFKNL